MLILAAKCLSRDLRWECRVRAPRRESRPLAFRGPEDYRAVGPDRASVRPVLTPALLPDQRPSCGAPVPKPLSVKRGSLSALKAPAGGRTYRCAGSGKWPNRGAVIRV